MKNVWQKRIDKMQKILPLPYFGGIKISKMAESEKA